jgi:DNA repair protein RecN (Recombination protein N)
MLRSLVVRDLALVEEAALDLGPGLTLLNGETGSGKPLRRRRPRPPVPAAATA